MLLNVFIFLINFVIKSIGTLIGTVINLLPNSPFLVLGGLEFEYLDTLNWILPLSFCLNVLAYWVGAIALYYIVSIPMRFAKVIE